MYLERYTKSLFILHAPISMSLTLNVVFFDKFHDIFKGRN